MLKTFEYRIYPDAHQEEQIAMHIGSVRWLYNYALEKKMKAWSTERKNLSRFDIQKDLPRLKKEEATEWLKEINSQSLQASLEHLEKAYTKFFKEKRGFPRFKSKHFSKQSFEVPQHHKVDFEKSLLIIPKIKPIKIRLCRTFVGKVKTITIKKTPTHKYFALVLVETVEEPREPKAVEENTTLGIDLGIKDFATLSTGEKIANPKTLYKHQRKLARAQRILCRRAKGSKNRERAKLNVAKIHEKVTNVRKDFLHKLSHKLTHENQVASLVIEDLNVRGMIRNHNLAKSISDCSWGEFARQLEYKSRWYGKNLLKIGRFEPSSKLCSNCGTINQDLTLKEREWTCKSCGSVHDRDVNAAINIKNLGLNKKNTYGT